MTKHKQYGSVSQMVADLSDSPEFVQEFEKRLEKRRVVKHLLAMRAIQGISQEDIASKMKCSQSKISKLENGNDADVSLQDLFGYIDALGLDAQIVVSQKLPSKAEGSLPAIQLIEKNTPRSRSHKVGNSTPSVSKKIWASVK